MNIAVTCLMTRKVNGDVESAASTLVIYNVMSIEQGRERALSIFKEQFTSTDGWANHTTIAVEVRPWWEHLGGMMILVGLYKGHNVPKKYFITDDVMLKRASDLGWGNAEEIVAADDYVAASFLTPLRRNSREIPSGLRQKAPLVLLGGKWYRSGNRNSL